MSAPSKAAMRAAEALTTFAGIKTDAGRKEGFCCPGSEWDTVEMAEVIERETGVGELVEALRDARVALHYYAGAGYGVKNSAFEAMEIVDEVLCKWKAK